MPRSPKPAKLKSFELRDLIPRSAAAFLEISLRTALPSATSTSVQAHRSVVVSFHCVASTDLGLLVKEHVVIEPNAMMLVNSL